MHKFFSVQKIIKRYNRLILITLFRSVEVNNGKSPMFLHGLLNV
jgi:hypothetical protein